jgi:hypothetical protein
MVRTRISIAALMALAVNAVALAAVATTRLEQQARSAMRLTPMWPKAGSWMSALARAGLARGSTLILRLPLA